VRANSNWEVANSSPAADGEHNAISFKICDSEATTKFFPNKFELTVTHSVEDDAFHTNVTVKNNNPYGFSFSFQFLLHTYLAIPDIEAVSIHGLQGKSFIDGLRDRQVFTEEDAALGIHAETDRVYLRTEAVELLYGDGSAMNITKQGLADTVVWNPWDSPPADVGEGEWRKFVCIESGQVEHAVTLAAGDTWTATQQMRLVPAAAL
jgi:glucose-6-phosphate 1-epimerase